MFYKGRSSRAAIVEIVAIVAIGAIVTIGAIAAIETIVAIEAIEAIGAAADYEKKMGSHIRRSDATALTIFLK